ncbi:MULTISPECIES: hypothetical protein [Halocynthiibacter]|uniref:Transporter n=1 Tax=Halocynthiibacter halioticoli TaxID=2986804 RepID=A0AAE3LRB5_9RHOB|nr:MULTISPECIES: hypothetical protein [Halocynthiibacter]MCV6824413.1 hypothetical protein [Halocynthiibacter halioticoli]MCW4057414.1 hypothetical protein [Halocynthiibacter sp. SDUM655004]
MNKLLSTGAILASSTIAAHAGGLERADQSVLFMFEKGSYAEIALGHVNPSVSGSLDAAPSVTSGDMLESYTTGSLSYKTQLNDQWHVGIQLSEPHGADVAYPTSTDLPFPYGTAYPLQGTTAQVDITNLTAIVRYQANENVSVYGGMRVGTASGKVDIPLQGYTMSTNRQADYGYLAGVAYERPDIALRVALTYNSAITHEFSVEENGAPSLPFETTMPQSVNLEFQTGIAADTLLFGVVRWVDWSEFDISPAGYAMATGGDSLVSYDEDTVSYRLGIGRQFTDAWSGALTIGYEGQSSGFTGNLGPTNGYTTVGVAASYTHDNMKITAGIQYAAIGEANTDLGAFGTTTFDDNSAIGAGVRIGFSY